MGSFVSMYHFYFPRIDDRFYYTHILNKKHMNQQLKTVLGETTIPPVFLCSATKKEGMVELYKYLSERFSE